jgi:starch phosphorylase
MLRAVLDLIASGTLAGGDGSLFRPIVDQLLTDDPYMLLADYQSYVQCQDRVSALWRDQAAWTSWSIVNVARVGRFSSDRSIAEYCERIWHVRPRRPDLD